MLGQADVAREVIQDTYERIYKDIAGQLGDSARSRDANLDGDHFDVRGKHNEIDLDC